MANNSLITQADRDVLDPGAPNPGWIAYQPNGSGKPIPGTYFYLVQAMRAARAGLPWFEAVAKGAKVKPANAG